MAEEGTEKLYLHQPLQTSFSARVLRQQRTQEGWQVALDRTLFYPTSGGQPYDTGTLSGCQVVDVVEQAGEILHRLNQGPLPEDQEIQGTIDWARRFDHMQQHTGQHILSQAFERVLGLHTVAFHIGAEATTIDLNTPTLAAEEAARVEDLSNDIIFADRPVTSFFASAEESANLDLRKVPVRHGSLRIVDIEGFDRMACGGTHCGRTGEVGIIKVIRWERRGTETRVEFLCGQRALLDYRWKNTALYQAAEALNSRAQEVSPALSRVMAEREAYYRQVEDMRGRLLGYEAAELAGQAESCGGIRVVRAILSDRRPDELKWLAQRITEIRPALVLLASRGEKGGHLVFARSSEVEADAAALLRAASSAIGGRGGGRAEMAQGGAPVDKLEEALEAAVRSLAGGN